MTSNRRREFKVAVNIPYGMTAADMRAYIEEAVCAWSGSKDPDSPVYDLDRKSVTVSAIKTPPGPSPAGKVG